MSLEAIIEVVWLIKIHELQKKVLIFYYSFTFIRFAHTQNPPLKNSEYAHSNRA